MNSPDIDSNQSDPILDDVKAWMATPPPGLEKLEQLRAPRVPQRPVRPRRPLRNRIWAVAGIAAVFMIGFAMGRQTQSQDVGTRPETVQDGLAVPRTDSQQAIAEIQPAPVSATPVPIMATPAVKPDITPIPTAPANVAQRYEVASLPIRQTETADGKLIIETQLAKSGGRATWLVDSGLSLTNKSN